MTRPAKPDDETQTIVGGGIDQVARVLISVATLSELFGGDGTGNRLFAISAQIMRRILVDHARAHLREKRGGGTPTLVLNEAIDYPGGRSFELIALDARSMVWPSSIPNRAAWLNCASLLVCRSTKRPRSWAFPRLRRTGTGLRRAHG